MGRAASVLVLDDGELEDVEQILQDAGASFGRVRGEAIAVDTPPPRDLLVATPRRIGCVAQLKSVVYGREPVRVVVVDEDSVTLRAQLRRLGFDYLVRRPVHPDALRLLVLRCLYSGREKRREPRVPIGCRISFKAGLLPHKATLADLSTGGCRLLSPYRVAAGKRVQIQLEVPGARGVRVAGHVIRSHQAPHPEGEDAYVAAVRFMNLSKTARAAIDHILVERAAGPARLDEPAATGEGPALPTPVPPEARRARGERLPRAPRGAVGEPAEGEPPAEKPPAPSDADTQPEMVDRADLEDAPADPAADLPADLLGDDGVLDEEAAGACHLDEDEDLPTDPTLDIVPLRPGAPGEVGGAEAPADATEPAEARRQPAEARKPAEARGERRRRPRGVYPRKVTGIGDKASRVLICRDLSAGGMRIEALPELEVGDRLHLALYDDASGEPVLLWGTLARDDGEAGMAITFDGLPRAKAHRLEKLVANLPAIESLGDDEASAMGTVVGEILES